MCNQQWEKKMSSVEERNKKWARHKESSAKKNKKNYVTQSALWWLTSLLSLYAHWTFKWHLAKMRKVYVFVLCLCVCVYFIGIVLSPHQLFLKYFFELHTLDSSLHTRCDAMPYTRLAETTGSIVWQWTIVQCDNVVVRHWRFHGLSTQNRWWKKREIT